jgi:hypothetical protein
MVLYGLCGSARGGLVFEAHPDAAGVVVARFVGRNGGTGQVAIPDQAALRSTLDWLAAHPRAEVVLRAVLAAVRACDGVVGGWAAAERVLELQWGPRKPGQSRARKLPPVRALVCPCSWSTCSNSDGWRFGIHPLSRVERRNLELCWVGSRRSSSLAGVPPRRVACRRSTEPRGRSAPFTW